jgi:hypothetical protein
MRFALLLLAFAPVVSAQSSEESAVIAVAQRLFDAMKTHDADAARALALPGARHVSVRPDGKVNDVPHEQFATRIGAAKEEWLERMWSPKVLIRGNVAVLWADYDFHRAGKFTHCGVDSFSFVKTPEGWKMAGISYTVEPTGCAPSPLGEPK